MRETQIHQLLLQATHAESVGEAETIQQLWSGYGTIKRYALSGTDISSVVVKQVSAPEDTKHPRGWNTDFSHKRKLRSYDIELTWYVMWAQRLDSSCKVPEIHAAHKDLHTNSFVLIMQDLDAAGFDRRLSNVSLGQAKTCLRWLAYFHASFLGQQPDGLWETGTYWHLDTRPDELQALKDKELKAAAAAIDKKLKECTYQTFVHGDAKLANFCFSNTGEQVAAVDFQYVGGGCGMKDVAYFIGSCFGERDCERLEDELLDYYFDALVRFVDRKHSDIDTSALAESWRNLFPYAWADFHRFIKGWSPGHWKINSYSERITTKVLADLWKQSHK